LLLAVAGWVAKNAGRDPEMREEAYFGLNFCNFFSRKKLKENERKGFFDEKTTYINL
jgi:hypothetical protein